MFSVTPLVRNLIIINVVVFLLQSLMPISSTRCMEFQYSPGLSGFISLWPIGTCAFAPYQFFTYMFAHGGFGHIFFNMLALASFAPILENHWGDKKFLTFYVITGMGAGILYAAVNYFLFPGSGGSTSGARSWRASAPPFRGTDRGQGTTGRGEAEAEAARAKLASTSSLRARLRPWSSKTWARDTTRRARTVAAASDEERLLRPFGHGGSGPGHTARFGM